MGGGAGKKGNVVSLSQVRKARARAAKRADAEANALKHGRSKADRARDADKAERSDAHLDAHKRDDD